MEREEEGEERPFPSTGAAKPGEDTEAEDEEEEEEDEELEEEGPQSDKSAKGKEGVKGKPKPKPKPKSKKDKKGKKKKKGNWKNIDYEPITYELYPCAHRWKKKHPKGPCPKYKQIRYVPIPISDRINQLAKPLLRRMLAAWLENADKMSPEMRERLMKNLIEEFGLTHEFLEQLKEEAEKEKAKREAAKRKGEGKGKKKRKKGKRRRRRRGKRRKKKGKKGKKKKGKKGKKKKGKKGKKGKKKGKKEKKEKGEREKKGPQSGLIFKKRKGGKLPLDWPHKMGSNLLLKCIAILSRDPDEDYNSRAQEYFDVQSMAILEQFCNYLDMPLPDPDKPTQYGEALVIMALNLSDWVAKYVTTPAQAIPDDKVEALLDLKGTRPKPPKKVKEKKPKAEGKKGKKGKKAEQPPPPEPETEVQRNWDELKSPVYVPEKSRISKRKPLEEEEGQEPENTPAPEPKKESPDEGLPRWVERTLDDVKQEFLEYTIWYDPWEPEFMYSGPKKLPEGIETFNIWDPDSEEVPDDLRVLNWTQIPYGFKDGYSYIPSPVPQYYPTLRPLRPIKLENVEKSGIPQEIIKKNLRFFSPWYLMKKPLKPPPPEETYDEENKDEAFLGEYEEDIEDEMLENKEPPIKDSIWGDAKMKEQIEILGHLVYLMASEPNLTIEYVFVQLEEFCDAVDCAEQDENPTAENRLLNKKRTIILEQYFVDFFGKKFRDYNDRTPYYMRKICSRFAYYIQILYEHTARILWELQSCPNTPTPVPSRPETPDDPDALRDWNDWLEWLQNITKTCDDWAGWISDTVAEAERKAAKKKREYVNEEGKKEFLTEKEWFDWKTAVESKVFQYRSFKRKVAREAPYYLQKAENLLPVKHRKVDCSKGEEEGEYGEFEEEGEADVEALAWERVKGSRESRERESREVESRERGSKSESERQREAERQGERGGTRGRPLDDETDWEDVGEEEG